MMYPGPLHWAISIVSSSLLASGLISSGMKDEVHASYETEFAHLPLPQPVLPYGASAAQIESSAPYDFDSFGYNQLGSNFTHIQWLASQ